MTNTEPTPADVELKACPFCGIEAEIADVPTASQPIVHHPPGRRRDCALADKFIPLSAWNTRALSSLPSEREQIVGKVGYRSVTPTSPGHAWVLEDLARRIDDE